MEGGKVSEVSYVEEASKDITSSLSECETDQQPPTSGVTDEVETSHLQGTVVENSKTSVQHDPLSELITPFSPGISNKSATTTEDAATVPSEVHSILETNHMQGTVVENSKTSVQHDPLSELITPFSPGISNKSATTTEDAATVPSEVHSILESVSSSECPTDPQLLPTPAVADEVETNHRHGTLEEKSKTSVQHDIPDSPLLDQSTSDFIDAVTGEVETNQHGTGENSEISVQQNIHDSPLLDQFTFPSLDIVTGEVHTYYGQSTPVDNSETSIWQGIPDGPLLDHSTSTGEIDNSETSIWQGIPDGPLLDHSTSTGEVEPYHRLGTPVPNSETSFRLGIPDGPLLDQTTSISLDISNKSGPIGDVETLPLEIHNVAESHIIDTSKEVVDNVPHQTEEASSISVADVQIRSDYPTSDESRKPEDSPILVPSNLNHHQVEVRSTQTETPKSADSSKNVKLAKAIKAVVDTAAPFESVKEAVSKFGGIVDWKAHKAHTLERRKHIQREIENLQEELPVYKRRTETAEIAKAQVLTELDNTKRLIEGLKLSLERAQTEEIQAKQDAELAQLRVMEMEQGIAGDASVAAQRQLDVAKARHESAVSELKSVKEELGVLKGEYLSLVDEKNMAMRKAEEAVSSSRESEKSVEDMTMELITLKESLESAHATHLEAEEHRVGAALAREQDLHNWEKELKQAEEEQQRLSEQLLLAKDLKSKLDTASSLLLNLKAEFAAYMELQQNPDAEITDEEKLTDDADRTTRATLALTRKELNQVKDSIEKAQDEVDCLRVAESSLRSELDSEKSAVTTLRQREAMASVAVSSLESELNRTRQELEMVLEREKETRERLMELPKLLQQAALEADQVKAVAQLSHEEFRKAKEEAEQAKAGVSTMVSRLRAALKEIDACRASERLALAAIKALEESDQSKGLDGEEAPKGVTLPLEEYYMLGKKAHEAEELANEKVAVAVTQIEVAKESELKSRAKLEEANKEMEERRESLRAATERAQKAMEGKLGVEQELRKWRAEHGQRRKAGDAAQAAATFEDGSELNGFDNEENTYSITRAGQGPVNMLPESKSKRRKSFFPRIVMFLARKKAHTVK